MINLIELARRNRLAGLFNPNQPTFEGSFNQMGTPPIDLGQPPNLNNDMTAQFQSLLGQFPQREKVGNWRKLGAVIAGLGSDNPMETADQFANYNYYNKLKDYTTKLPFFQKASENERALNNQIMTQWMQDRKQDEQEKYNRERIRIQDETQSRLEQKDRDTLETNRRKLDIAERRAAVYEFKARNPNHVFKTREDGRIVAINPQDPTKVIDTKVDSGELSDLDKANLQLDRALTLEGVRQTNRINLAKEKGEIAKDTITHRTLTGVKFGADKPLLPTQQGKKEDINARQLKTIKPEWADYIEMDESNRFIRVNPKSKGGIFGMGSKQLSPSEIKDIGDIIFGRKPMPTKNEAIKNDPLGIRK